MVGSGAYHDSFRLLSRADHDAVGRRKILLPVEILRQLEGFLLKLDALDAVESVKPRVAELEIAAENIPAALEQFDAIRLYGESEVLRSVEGVVRDPDAAVLLHGVEQRRKMFAPRGNLIDENPAFQREVFADRAPHGEGIEHPLLKPVFIDIFRISNIIEIPADFLTVDNDAELLENGIPPAIERGSVQRLISAQILFPLPAVRQILVRDLPGAPDRVNQPRILLQLGIHIDSL